MKNKPIFIGGLIGLIANFIGLFLCVQLFGNGNGFIETIKQSIANDFFGKLISIGAILNLGAFFVFIRKREDEKAKGVLLVTVIIAIITFVIKFS